MDKLFTYGTLRNPETQQELLGRTLGVGVPDTLRGYRLAQLQGIHHVYTIIQPWDGGIVDGLVFDIGADELAQMKPSAYLINISRGVVVKLDALVDALESGTIAGAALDVYETEPLPEGHPLWGMKNVILTPHVAADNPHVPQRRIDTLSENLRRYLAGEEPRNIVDKKRLF
jgi:hypothetical protein